MTDRSVQRVKNLLGLALRPRPVVGATPADVVHCENKWRLLRYRARAGGLAGGRPVVLVPSLINRHFVLDLQPGKSFAEWLVARGHDVFVVDWGTPGPEDRYLSFDEICDRYLARVLQRSTMVAGCEKAHVLGYCLGGTLAVIHTAARPERVASLTALAAPVTFDDDGLLSRWTRVTSFDVGAVTEAFGNVPWQLMQSAFHLLRPTLTLSKAAHMIDRAWDDEFLDGFFALETWGNDNVSFPGEAFKSYVDGLYRENGLVTGRFALSGRRVNLGAIECPVMAVTFEHDTIVPWKSAAVLLEKISSREKKHVHLSGGHVGAVVSRKAATTLWPTMSDWWHALDRAEEIQTGTKCVGGVTGSVRAQTKSRPPSNSAGGAVEKNASGEGEKSTRRERPQRAKKHSASGKKP